MNQETENDNWISFKDIDFNNPSFNRFNIDTRDFHGTQYYCEKPHPDIFKLAKYPSKFFLTTEELKLLLERLYNESGGEQEWRMMDLIHNDSRVKNWNLKYLRIYKHESNFIICNSDKVAIPKDILSSPVDKEYL